MNAVRRSALAVARGGCDEPAKLRRSPLDIEMVRDCAFGRLGPRPGCRLTIALFHLTTDAPPRTPSPSRRRRPDRTSSPSTTSTSSTLSVSMTTPTILGASSTATRRCHARARRVASVDSFSLGTANRRSTSLKKKISFRPPQGVRQPRSYVGGLRGGGRGRPPADFLPDDFDFVAPSAVTSKAKPFKIRGGWTKDEDARLTRCGPSHISAKSATVRFPPPNVDLFSPAAFLFLGSASEDPARICAAERYAGPRPSLSSTHARP